MGKLSDGKWVKSAESTTISKSGDFVRGTTKFRERMGSDPGRYHLWVAPNCPWAHRTMIVRNLRGLTDHVGMNVAHYRRNEDGWWFAEGLDDLSPVDGRFALHVLYGLSNPDYSGSATVPVLWDRHERSIVNNESAEIIVMLNAIGDGPDLYPEDKRGEIDEVNDWVYDKINNGVYRCGFARSQEAYERAFVPLFEALDEVDVRLSRHRYLVGDQITLADVRLFTTLVRFDAVYYGHFKCNKRRIADYAHTQPYLRDLYATPGFGETVDVEIYKKGYMGRSPGINPSGIIPRGPEATF